MELVLQVFLSQLVELQVTDIYNYVVVNVRRLSKRTLEVRSASTNLQALS